MKRLSAITPPFTTDLPRGKIKRIRLGDPLMQMEAHINFTDLAAELDRVAPCPVSLQDGRNSQMHQTRKGHQWHFCMKVHVGTDVDSGLIPTVSVTPAKGSDISQLPGLLREEDWAPFCDKGYVDNRLKRAARKTGTFWDVALKATKQQPFTSANTRTNRERSSIRVCIKHIFRMMQRKFGYTKVRYRGLAKNAAYVFTLVVLTNLYRARRRIEA